MKDPHDNMVATRGGGDNLIPRARGSHLERNIMAVRGSGNVPRARGSQENTILDRDEGGPWTGIPIDTKVAIRGGGEHSIPRAGGSHLERDIMVARGNEKLLKARGPHDNVLIDIK